jgi:DNA processing protein
VAIDSFKEILRLESVKYLNTVSIYKLLSAFETAEKSRDGSEEELLAAGVSVAGIKSLKGSSFDDSVYLEQLEKLNELQEYGMTTVFDENYPANLKNIYDPPLYLFYEGILSEKDDISIAVVGSRSVSSSGKYTIARLSRELAQAGYVIVSGLAMGADSVAHTGATEAGKRTVAVLGSGIDCDVNLLSRPVRKAIVESGGAVFSPFLIGTRPTTYTFPARNRVISGISLGVVIGEAKKDSGSLITANFALEQGREVFAIPNEIYRAKYEGGNNLIKTGQAKLVMSVDDITDEMPERVRNRTSDPANAVKNKLITFSDETEERIYYILLDNSKSIDEMSEETGLDTGLLMSKLFMLEMNKLIVREQNNVFSIARK